MGQLCRCALRFFFYLALRLSTANYKTVSAHLDGIPESEELQQKYLRFRITPHPLIDQFLKVLAGVLS
jgi:hypothetical protein